VREEGRERKKERERDRQTDKERKREGEKERCGYEKSDRELNGDGTGQSHVKKGMQAGRTEDPRKRERGRGRIRESEIKGVEL